MIINYCKFKTLFITSLLLVIAVSCSDIETETNGYASLKINLDDVSSRNTGRSKLASGMTSSEAKTILAVLVPAVQCETSSASSSMEYSRALVDTITKEAQFVVPLATQVKLCLYFYRDTYSLNELSAGNNTSDGLGESGIFSIDSETTAKTIEVEFWTTLYSTVNIAISSSESSVGIAEGVTGTVKLNSNSGMLIDNQTFTTTSLDNAGKTVVFTNVVYSTYSANIELDGFYPVTEAFLVSSETETLDVIMTPHPVEIGWLSFDVDSMSIVQEGTSSYAKASGKLILNVPIAQKDKVTQMISLMQVKRVGLNNLADVTPPISLSNWTKSEGTDYVTYSTLFSTASAI